MDRSVADRSLPHGRPLVVLLVLAVAVSIVHYVDNVVNYDDFPLATSIPNPPDWLVGLGWFLFTAAGVYGYVHHRRGHRSRAALGLAAYSGSGLIGFFHYAAPGALEMPWWRQLHIVADILCGLAIFAFAITIARGPSRAATAEPISS